MDKSITPEQVKINRMTKLAASLPAHNYVKLAERKTMENRIAMAIYGAKHFYRLKHKGFQRLLRKSMFHRIVLDKTTNKLIWKVGE